MDEMLFISMAKLGADRLHEERQKRAATLPNGVDSTPAASYDPAQRMLACRTRDLGAERGIVFAGWSVATLIFALALSLGAALIGREAAAPAGQVYITELGNADAPVETRLAQAQSTANRR